MITLTRDNNVNQYCRTCLLILAGNFKEKSFIKYNLKTTENLALWIQDLSSLRVLDTSCDGGYPEYVCEECYIKLGDFHKFQQLVHETTKTLNSLFNNAETHVENTIYGIKCESRNEEREFVSSKIVFEKEVDTPIWPCKPLEALETLVSSDTSFNLLIKKTPKTEDEFLNVDPENLLQNNYYQEIKDDSKAEEEKRLKNVRVRDVRRREKRKHDPIAHANYCQKERDRNRARKKQGKELKFKRISELSRHEQDERREKGREWVKNHRLRIRLNESKERSATCQEIFVRESEIKGSSNYQANLEQNTSVKQHCQHCNLSFSKKHDLTIHEQIHTGVKPYHCTLCDRRFRQSNTLKIHLKSHYRRNNLICCENEIQNDKNQDTKLETVSTAKSSVEINDKNSFITGTINKNLTRNTKQTDTKYHTEKNSQVILVTAEKSSSIVYKCDKCEIVFPHLLSLNAHKRNIHIEQTEYNRKLNAIQQENTKNGFKCHICPKVVTSAQSLKNHIAAVHNNLRPHVCQICDAKFAKKAQLGSHQRVHTGETPFSCEICGRRFRHGSNISRHKKIHQKELTGKRNSNQMPISELNYEINRDTNIKMEFEASDYEFAITNVGN